MDAQSESCEPPPCDPQPPGKIRKALKLFGKRKPGSSVASIFSIRGKGDGGPKSPPSRSKTQDGLNEPIAPEAEAEQVDLDQEDESQQEDAPMEDFTSGNMNSQTTPTRQSISSLTSAKSLSFLNMLRKGRKGLTGDRHVQTESQRPGRQRKGLKGLFGPGRWRGKEKEDEEEAEPAPPLLASRSNSVEIIKESLTLTPGPPPRSVDQTSEEKLQCSSPQEATTLSEDSAKVSGATNPPKNERLSTLLGDISSILSFDSLTQCGDIAADVEAEWVKASYRMEEVPTTLKVDKTSLSATSTTSRPTPSPTSTASSSISSKHSPSAVAKPIRSPSTTKPTPSPLTKPLINPVSSLVTQMSQTAAAVLSTTTTIPPAKPAPVPSPMPTTQPTPKPQATMLSTSPIQPAETPASVPFSQPAAGPTLCPTSKPTASPAKPARSPKSSTDAKLATISSTTLPMAETVPISTPLPAQVPTPAPETPQATPETPAITKIEPAPTPEDKHTQAPTPPTKPSINQESKNTTSATKNTPFPPPFGRQTPTAGPTPRPKLVTTFGLSTSRNTAPIAKSETKPTPAPNTKSTTHPGAVSVRKASISESTPPVTRPPSTTMPTSSVKSPNVISPPQIPPLKSPLGITPSFISSKREDDPGMDLREDSVASQSKAMKRGSAVRPTTLSKIPVSGGGRPAKIQHRDSQPNGAEDHSNLPTPGHEEESPFTLSRESSSKEALSDVSIDSGGLTPTLSQSQEDILDAKLGSLGATSLNRESKIPVKHGSTATYHSVQGRGETTRSKIPVSKMPVRRTSNKPATTPTAPVHRK
ncbi:hypothetical protein DNTS_026338 [Danionella cerebrum]|uniref:APC membrane recruitment protein 2-like n=1 Tax=Danionella cerebrum TaxID=2873325 RepID=A0A553QWJ1_9TELE|nr:hypothetical protein DNTS_026338 [Danionella translucida]